jgi:adenylate cyclase
LHAELRFEDGYWRIRDLNSTNGVKVNGMRVQDKLLHPKDEITISKRRFTIHYELPANRRAIEELEEDLLSQSLLEKAGLERSRRQRGIEKPGGFDPASFLLDDE